MVSIKEYVNYAKQVLATYIATFICVNKPTLGIVQVGNNPASERYVRNKIKDAEEVGMKAILLHLDENITMDDFLKEFKAFLPKAHGVIVQLPLPPQLDIEVIKEYIPIHKDVDGFKEGSPFVPCTPSGIMNWLKYNDYDFDGKNALVIGRSEIVGKPMAKLLLEANCTVTVAHSHTPEEKLMEFARQADLIVVAVGKPLFFDCEDLRKQIIIDVGINFNENGKMVGDCTNKYSNVTPVPGGVGLLTRVALLENVMKAYKYTVEGEGIKC